MSQAIVVRRISAALLATAALAAAAVAQDVPSKDAAPGRAAAKRDGKLRQAAKDRSKKTLSTQVHEAWLREVLDLDVKGAIKAYDKIRKQTPPQQPMRWIAVTRLAELKRFGVGTAEPSPTHAENAPPAIRDALETLREPLPIDDLLADPAAEFRLEELHPATRLTQDWVREQLGPTVDARWLQRMARYRRWADSQPSQYWWAADILRVELRGRRSQADALRKLWFSEWQPRKITGDKAKLLADVRERLKAWIDDQEISSQQRARLRRLSEHCEKQITADENGDPTAALELIARLPTFAERLIDGVIPKPAEKSGNGNRRNR